MTAKKDKTGPGNDKAIPKAKTVLREKDFHPDQFGQILEETKFSPAELLRALNTIRPLLEELSYIMKDGDHYLLDSWVPGILSKISPIRISSVKSSRRPVYAYAEIVRGLRQEINEAETLREKNALLQRRRAIEDQEELDVCSNRLIKLLREKNVLRQLVRGLRQTTDSAVEAYLNSNE